MEANLKKHLEYLLCVRILNIRTLSGSALSETYLLETETERFFCKIHRGPQALDMFRSEQSALKAIAATKTVATPTVRLCEGLEKGALLLMDFVAPKRPEPNEMVALGHQLAAQHKLSHAPTFGWEADNFIGSLPQSNTRDKNWAAFYVRERLLPQLRRALDAQLLKTNDIPSEAVLLKTCENVFPEAVPCLLHGDLWSGNVIISNTGTPYLIDPAVYYGHYEVDLAMTRLFGGFPEVFYRAHASHFPVAPYAKERNELYQLYYLLVHLNLFGSSYYTQVSHILKRYFN
ncbi:fructosamine kinase family protein [Maribacter sp. 2-571]|uniref:fructosamine kinase family protein n=1 Tax=Maribacter sp. 2-571 TaxID=3417569 RepID=UPI003D346263